MWGPYGHKFFENPLWFKSDHLRALGVVIVFFSRQDEFLSSNDTLITIIMIVFAFTVIRKKFGVLNNILEHIGNTPLVRLDKIKKDKGLKCDLCKCHLFRIKKSKSRP